MLHVPQLFRGLHHKAKAVKGFTIIELLVVIAIIGILASIIFVGYNAAQTSSRTAQLTADLAVAHNTIIKYQDKNGEFPTGSDCTASPAANTVCVKTISGETISTFFADSSASPQVYCLSMKLGSIMYYIDRSGLAVSGDCPYYSGRFIQIATTATCPTTMSLAIDARDNRTYWIQKLSDGVCWMLTNLAYVGGGTNTYGDVKTITLDPGAGVTSYTQPGYYIPPSGANPITSPTLPSISTTGTGQYGYFYNWCAAMGGQATGACSSIATPTPDLTITICPAGWRLPTSNGGEFTALNNAVNGGSTTSDTGLRTTWLGQYGGYWINGSWSYQGSRALYWSSYQYAPNSAYDLWFYSTKSAPSDASTKHYGYSIRCVAN